MTLGKVLTSPPGNVRTDQGNTYSTGVQDLTLASGLVIPNSAGLTLSALAQLGYDTTQRAYLGYGGIQGQGSFPRLLMYAKGNGSTDVLAANSGEQAFDTDFLIKNGFFIAGKTLWVIAHFAGLGAAASNPAWKIGLRIGAADGITGTLIWQNVTGITQAAGAAVQDFALSWLISGTAAAGASVNVEVAVLDGHLWNGAGGSIGAGSPVAVVTNADETLTLTATSSNSTASTSLTLRRLWVAEMN